MHGGLGVCATTLLGCDISADCIGERILGLEEQVGLEGGAHPSAWLPLMPPVTALHSVLAVCEAPIPCRRA